MRYVEPMTLSSMPMQLCYLSVRNVAKWEQQTGNKAEADSMKARLQRKQQEVQERENSRQSHRHKNARGAR